MQPELILTHMSGSRDGETVCLTPQSTSAEVSFGRLTSCRVSLPDDPEISRTHAKLYWRDLSWWLEDLGSSNGTFVGEFAQSKRIASPITLSPGQVFRVGCSRFRLEPPDKNLLLTERHVERAERHQEFASSHQEQAATHDAGCS